MFHPDLRLLRSFEAIATELSVTRAAERLHLTQPTVSGQIKELERAVGFALFHRTTRSVSLTSEGARLLPKVRAVLLETEALCAEVAAMQTGQSTRFKLGAAMYSLDFPDRLALLNDFTVAAPEISYIVDNRLQSAQIPDLIAGRLDVSLILGIAVPPALDCGMREGDPGTIVNETQYPDTLRRVVLRRQPMKLLVPRGSRLAAFTTIPRAALAGEQIAMLSPEHGHALTDPIEAFFEHCGAMPLRLAEGNALALERHAERHGMNAIGIDWFPVLPGLEMRPVEGMDFYLDFAVVLSPGANRAAQRFFDFAGRWQAARERMSGVAAVPREVAASAARS